MDEELHKAQRTLARALGRARAGEDRELAQRVRENGEALGQMLSGLLKMSRVHAPDNKAFDAPVAEAVRALQALGEQVGSVALVAVEDQAYVNEMRLRAEAKHGLRELGAELARHNVGGITFHAPLDGRRVRALVGAFAAPPGDPHPRTALRGRLAAAGLAQQVELFGIYRFRTTDEATDGRIDPVEALQRALRLSAQAWEAMASGRALNPLPLRRTIAEILEVGPLSPALWSGWVGGFPRHEHALTVALHAVLLGEAAGLPRAALQDLGVAALVHDVGYASLPAGAAAAGPEGLARHPGEGARVLLRQRGFSGAKLRRLRAVLDHHRGEGDGRGRTSTVGAILRIAEDYSGFLRVYGDRVTATDVLGAMSRAAGTVYQPTLLQVFVNALGQYPPGSLLELADGHQARSASPVRSRETFAAPLARLCDPSTGAPTDQLLDLAKGPSVRRPLPG
jgi:hypothetical protein